MGMIKKQIVLIRSDFNYVVVSKIKKINKNIKNEENFNSIYSRTNC